MKVSELTGAQLDYWVAMAEGMAVQPPADGQPVLRDRQDGIFALPYQPSSQWADAGPIIEREEIDVGSPGRRVHRMGGPNAGWGRSGIWGACTWRNGAHGRRSFGWDETSPLVAAMRCYVMHKFGDEVAQEGKSS